MADTLDCVVVVPVYNEAAAIRPVIEEWIPVLRKVLRSFIVLIVDDGSTDTTPAACDELASVFVEVRVIHQRNTGHGMACVRGYREAVRIGGTWTLQIDSDGQCDPCYFEELWRNRSGSPAVYGVRFNREDGRGRELISLFCRLAVRLTIGVTVPDANVPYRLYRTSLLPIVLDGFPAIHLANILISVVFYMAFSVRIREVPITFRDRAGGEPAVKLGGFARRGLEMIMDLRSQRAWIRQRAMELEVSGVPDEVD